MVWILKLSQATWGQKHNKLVKVLKRLQVCSEAPSSSAAAGSLRSEIICSNGSEWKQVREELTAWAAQRSTTQHTSDDAAT